MLIFLINTIHIRDFYCTDLITSLTSDMQTQCLI